MTHIEGDKKEECDGALSRLRREGCEFQANLGYIGSPCLRRREEREGAKVWGGRKGEGGRQGYPGARNGEVRWVSWTQLL
jgi:hypothetical protein